MRIATPNEQRAISREYCGFYNALVIGAVYEFKSDFDVRSSRSFFGAAKRCVDKYPSLSVVVRDMHTDAAYFERVSTINLEDHISVVGEGDPSIVTSQEADDGDELAKIEALMPSILDKPWPASRPPWRIVVLPLASAKLQTRCFVAFSFSHTLGDGIIALAFHRTFIQGISDPVEGESPTLTTPITDFPAPFDTAKNLPISWRFLLAPLIAVLLPKFITDILGLRATTSAVNPDTWTGVRMFFEPESFRTNLRLLEIQGPEVENVLQLARKNGAKLTATIHQSIVRALSKAVPSQDATNFVSGTAVNMRRAFGISNDEMGFFTNACYEFHARADGWASPWSDETWASARRLTEKLAECAVTLNDQPVGLLRYVPSISKWTAAKIGQERDASYELSNLGAFDAGVPLDSTCITKMVFSRPVDAVSAPLTFSAVGVKGGSLVISVAWQAGALGIPVETESMFVDGICAFLKEDWSLNSSVF